MKRYNRGNLNEVANTYKKMILEDSQSNNSNTPPEPIRPFGGPSWEALPPLKLPKKPPVPYDIPEVDDLMDDDPDRLSIRPYRAPGTKAPIRLPTIKPGTGGVGGGLLGRALGPAFLAASLGYGLGTFIDQVFINPRPKPPQANPFPTQILPAPESLYPGPSSAGGFRGRGSGNAGGGGMGGM